MPPSADELEAEREKLVEAVAVAKSGKPEDPIKAYHDYAEWLIAHRAEDKTSLFRLLKEATDAYKDSHDLYYDRRFLDIWCWYASRVNKPSAVYTFCLKRKIGTVFSKLYLEYGAYLIKTGDPTKAAQVYKAGISKKCRPPEPLEKALAELTGTSAGRNLETAIGTTSILPSTSTPVSGSSLPAPSSAILDKSSRPSSSKQSLSSSTSSTFPRPSPTATADELAAYQRLTYMRQYVRSGGAATAGKRPERLMLDVPSIFNAEGVEYSFEEVRAKKLGLLDKKWPKPEPWEYHYPSAPAPTRAPVSSVKFAETTVSHAAPADTSEASFASTVSPPVSPGQQQLVNFDGPGFGPSGASRTQVYKRMGNMGAGFGMAVPEPTVTINTKESLDDVYGMMNSPEKTMHSGAKPGSKYAPVKRLDQGGSSLSRTPLFGRTLSSENAAPIPTFQPFTDENDGAGGGFVPFVDENANPARPKTPAAGPSRPALTPSSLFKIHVDEELEEGPASTAIQPYIDEEQDPDPPSLTRTPSIQPFVDEEPEPRQSPSVPSSAAPLVPFVDDELSVPIAPPPPVAPAFQPFTDDKTGPRMPLPEPEFKTPFNRRPLGDKERRTPFAVVTPAQTAISPDDEDDDPIIPTAPPVEMDSDDEEKRPELLPTMTPSNSTGEYSGTFRSVSRNSTSSEGTSVFGKSSVFVPRARTISQGADDRTRSISTSSSATTTAASNVFRSSGGSVFRPKTPAAPFRPRSRQGATPVAAAAHTPVSVPSPAFVFAPSSQMSLASQSSVFASSSQTVVTSQSSAQPFRFSPAPPTPDSNLTPEPSQEPFVPLHVATIPRHELEISELEDPSPVDQFNNMPSPAISVEEFGIQGSSEEELHTPIDGLHTPVEELQDPLNHRQHIGRFGTVNLMTPIAERTMEFTASTLRSVANTPSRGVSARESQQYALYMANKHAGELREEDEEGEEPQNVAATLWPTKAAEADEHADVSMKAVALPIDDGEGLEVSNPCHPHEPEVLAYALQDLTSLEGFHDLSMETGGHLDVLQKFAKRNDSHAHLPLTIAGRKFFVSRKLGEGGFGAVFAARDGGVVSQDDDDSSDDEDDEAEDNVALKVVRPRNRWEFHIIRHIHAVLPEELRRSIILPSDLFVFRDESFLVLELRTQGTLLEMVNKAAALQLSRPGQPVDELLVMYFAIELLRTLEGLHREGIIHGDLKIDNCLIRLQEVPGSADSWSPQYQADGSDGWAYKGISLIDFGRAVNTRLFPPDQTFVGDWPTDARDCLEAREGRPWTYQTDYFGLAGIVYCMLFGKYIDASSVILNEQDGRYKFASPIKRYWQIDIWTALFDVLLNPTMVHADGRLPLCDELGALRNEMEAWLEKNCKRQGQQSLKSSLKRIERGIL